MDVLDFPPGAETLALFKREPETLWRVLRHWVSEAFRAYFTVEDREQPKPPDDFFALTPHLVLWCDAEHPSINAGALQEFSNQLSAYTDPCGRMPRKWVSIAELERTLERAIAITQRIEALAETAIQQGRPDGIRTGVESGELLARASLAMGETANQVWAIASSEQSAEQRARDICDVDATYWGWNSPAWSKLLDVTEQAIRNTDFWRIDRPKHFADARELWKKENRDRQLPSELRD